MLDRFRSWFARRRTPADQTPLFSTRTVAYAAGQAVNRDRALSYATAWACGRVICESISQLPWGVFAKVPEGRRHLTSHPADRLLSVQPCQELTPAVFRECLVLDAIFQGNGYAEIERDPNTFVPLALHLIRPDIVEPMRDEAGNLAYLVYAPGRDPIVIPAADMFHLRGLGDALAGYSIISYHARSIGLALAEQDTQIAFVENDARPMGLLMPVGPVRPEARRTIEELWKEWTGGKNKYRTLALPQQMEYKPLGINNTDAQMLEGRKFSTLEICRIFRVPPHKVAELQYATFSNIVHQSMEFVQDSLTPWIVKLEQEADRKLLGPNPRRRLYSKMNVNALLRGDFETRTRAYQMMFDRGIFSINDILELEDRNTIGPEGDARFVPANMTLLERAIEPPPPPPPPAPEAPPEEDDQADDAADDQAPSDRLAALRPVVRAAVRRILVRQSDRDDLGYNFRVYVRTQLAPLALPFADLLGGSAETILHRLEELADAYAAAARPRRRWGDADLERMTDGLAGAISGTTDWRIDT